MGIEYQSYKTKIHLKIEAIEQKYAYLPDILISIGNFITEIWEDSITLSKQHNDIPTYVLLYR